MTTALALLLMLVLIGLILLTGRLLRRAWTNVRELQQLRDSYRQEQRGVRGGEAVGSGGPLPPELGAVAALPPLPRSARVWPSPHRAWEHCTCPNPRPGQPWHCAAEAEMFPRPATEHDETREQWR